LIAILPIKTPFICKWLSKEITPNNFHAYHKTPNGQWIGLRDVRSNKYMGIFLHGFIIINEVASEWINIQWHYMLNTTKGCGCRTYGVGNMYVLETT
jgi:hypothetical protein